MPDMNELGILEGASKIDFKQVNFEQDDEAMRLFFYAVLASRREARPPKKRLT